MKRIGSLIGILFFLVACLDPFSFETSGEDVALVVEGQLNTSSGPHIMKISKSLAFGFKYFDPVSGADAHIVHGDETYDFIETEPGIYVIPKGQLSGKSGERYYVRIDLNGKVYESTPDILPIIQRADSAYWRKERDIVIQNNGIERIADVIKILVDTDINKPSEGGEVFVKWRVDELYLFTDFVCGIFDNAETCYIPISTINQNIQLYSSENLLLDRLVELPVFNKTTFPRVEFHGRHYFSVYQQSITRDAYLFWQKVNELTSQRGTVFDIPPASLTGNIRNINDDTEKVLGYFELASVDTVRTSIFPFEYKDAFDGFDYCNPFRRFEWPPECCFCNNLENSSLDRPEWIK